MYPFIIIGIKKALSSCYRHKTRSSNGVTDKESWIQIFFTKKQKMNSNIIAPYVSYFDSIVRNTGCFYLRFFLCIDSFSWALELKWVTPPRALDGVSQTIRSFYFLFFYPDRRPLEFIRTRKLRSEKTVEHLDCPG